MSSIIGLTGRAQHGKDSVAQVLKDEYGFVRMSFAARLKELAELVDPIIPGYNDHTGHYALIGPGIMEENFYLSQVVADIGWEEAKKNPEVRRFLQQLGTRAREVLGADVWVDAIRPVVESLRTNGYRVVISDVRFPNEAAFIRELGGRVVLVDRPGFNSGVPADHPSEAQVRDLGHEVVILNHGTLADLRSGTKAALLLHGALDRG